MSFVSGHILWVCGFLAAIGLPSPFARADTLDKLNATMMSDRAERIEHEILTIKQDQCKAQKENNEAAVRLYTERLQDLRTKFYELTHREARSPTCDEV